MQETWVRSLGWEDPLEEGMATHFSILAWRIPWTEEPGGLQSMQVQRAGHDWETFIHFFIVPCTGPSLWYACSWLQPVDFSLVAVHGFSSCSLQASLVVPCGFLVAVCGFSCPAARGILVPWQGVKPTSPFIGRQILNHWASNEVPREGPFKSLGLRFRTSPVVLYLRPVLPWTLALQGAQHKSW